MRVFQTAGVADEVHADMDLDCAVQWVRSDGEVLVQFLPTKQPLGWPVVNFLYQPTLETTLEALLDRYPHVEVRRGRELVDFTQDPDGVIGRPRRLQRHLVRGERQRRRRHDEADRPRAVPRRCRRRPQPGPVPARAAR